MHRKANATKTKMKRATINSKSPMQPDRKTLKTCCKELCSRLNVIAIIPWCIFCYAIHFRGDILDAPHYTRAMYHSIEQHPGKWCVYFWGKYKCKITLARQDSMLQSWVQHNVTHSQQNTIKYRKS